MDEAEQILRAQVDAGSEDDTGLLVELLADRGDLDELRVRANAGDGYAAELLADCDDVDEAEQILRAQVDAGSEDAASRLARLLAQRDDLDGLRTLANADEWPVAQELIIRELADLLARRDDLDGLRALANVGGRAGNKYVVRLLARHGDADGAEQTLRARADVGDKEVAEPLADVLIKQGRDQAAEQLRRFGLNSDGSIARS